MSIKPGSRPILGVYGDAGEQKVTKTIWSLFAGRDLRIQSFDSFTALEDQGPDMVMILMVINGPNDKNIELVQHLSRNQHIVCNIVAVTEAADVTDRVKILSQGFDAIIDFSVMDPKDLQQILINSLEKGRVRVENRVQQEEYKRFQAALAASPDAFIVLDQRRNIFFVSEHYKRAYPKHGEELLRRGVHIMEAYEVLSAEQNILPGDARYEQMRGFWDKLDGQTEITLDNGRTWRIKAAPLREGQGWIITTTDITDYSRQHDMLAEKSGALEKALEIEKEAAAIQKQFINMVSHEFRTPLSIIDGNAQILMRRFETLNIDQIRQRLTTVRSAVSRLVGMMEGVLSSNMLRTGRMDLQPQSFDIRPLMTEMCQEYADLSSKHVIDCLVDDLPEEVVLDKKALTLILSNLVGNAVKFSTEKPHIRVGGTATADHIILTVKDNGVGIPPNELNNVFERYYRATTAGSIPGTGIGLNLVHELVTLHQGQIEIKSEMGQGTEFIVTFPRLQDGQSLNNEEEAPNSAAQA